MKRRNFLMAMTAMLASPLIVYRVNAGMKGETVTNDFQLSDAQWRERLSKAQYHILRKEGTEPSGSSALNDEKRDGVYACAGCDLELFTSAMKYDSGTGWPSFYAVIADRIATKTDYKLFFPRTEYHCARCGGHQGHVFDDGPKPTGLRYCNNGLALNFIPA